ncbi:MAG: beta-ketoacyl synthase N-terminal-like domain-containing protein [Victivallales bacterium]
MICVSGISSLRAGADGLIAPDIPGGVRKRCGLRRADRYTAIAVAAAQEAAQDSPWRGKLPEDTGVIVAGFPGPHNTTAAFLDELLDYPEDQVLSAAFTHSVFNAAASYIALVLGVRGPEFSVTGVDDLLYEAFASADSMFRTGYCRRILLVTVLEKGVLTSALEQAGFSASAEYALAWVLSADPEEARYGRIETAEGPAAGEADPLKTAELIRAMGNQDLTVLKKGVVLCRN